MGWSYREGYGEVGWDEGISPIYPSFPVLTLSMYSLWDGRMGRGYLSPIYPSFPVLTPSMYSTVPVPLATLPTQPTYKTSLPTCPLPFIYPTHPPFANSLTPRPTPSTPCTGCVSPKPPYTPSTHPNLASSTPCPTYTLPLYLLPTPSFL